MWRIYGDALRYIDGNKQRRSVTETMAPTANRLRGWSGSSDQSSNDT